MLYGVRGTRAVFFVFYPPPPPPIFISAARRRKQRRRTPSALRGALPGSKFSSVRFVYGEDSCVRDVRVSPRVRIVWCLHAARAPGSGPGPSRRPQRPPTPRPRCACLLTLILNIYIHIQTQCHWVETASLRCVVLCG